MKLGVSDEREAGKPVSMWKLTPNGITKGSKKSRENYKYLETKMGTKPKPMRSYKSCSEEVYTEKHALTDLK